MTTQREAFEKFALKEGYPLEGRILQGLAGKHHEYIHSATFNAYKGWKAALEQPNEPVAWEVTDAGNRVFITQDKEWVSEYSLDKDFCIEPLHKVPPNLEAKIAILGYEVAHERRAYKELMAQVTSLRYENAAKERTIRELLEPLTVNIKRKCQKECK